ncbi:hypothetical protein ELI25_29480 (plasmid) [Rhizobium ruizarguesonis]|uniref:TniQ family protein n=1 Tax=Rhizobium ruizarguesonis TaxID=2081791 RepID=UPI0010317FD1|nr:TniQ family protein [Rhizobium ruizarguesonis]TAW06603.1 hypothetical protein ELI25_29480 [Rhizobium ruizarguesonis]
MSILHLTVPRQLEETLGSYCSRLAALHGAYSAREFSGYLGFSFTELLRGSDIHVEIFSRIASIEEADVREVLIQILGTTLRNVRGHMFTRDHIVSTKSKFCPHCLLDDESSGIGRRGSRAYMRISWLPRFSRVCPIHQSTLVTAIPGGLGMYGDAIGGLRADNAEWSDYLYRAELGQATPAQSYLIDRFMNRPTEELWLNKFPVQAAAHFIDIVGAVERHGIEVSFEKLDVLEQSACAQRGFEIAAGGQGSVKAFLAGLVKGYYRGRSNMGAHAIFGELADEMSYRANLPGYDRIVKLMQRVAIENLPIGPGDNFLGPVRQRRQLHSLTSAAEENEIGAHTLRNFMIERGLIASTKCSLARAVFHPSAIRDIIAPIKALGLTGAARAKRLRNARRSAN